MLSRESFKSFMTTLMDFHEFIDRLCDILNTNIWENDAIASLADEYLHLLGKTMECPEDSSVGSDISFFLFDCDCGKSDMSWIEYKGVKHSLTNLDELYDWLVFQKEENIQ